VVAALELYFDTDATRRIRVLWEALESEGVQSMLSLLGRRHRPHVSLAVADRLDPETVAPALSGMAAAPPLRLRFDFAGQFVGRVLWLGPAPQRELLDHQARVHQRLTDAGVAVWDKYTPGAWVPHCTLSMRVPNPLMGTAIRRCLEMLPIEATVVGAAVTDHARGIAYPLPSGTSASDATPLPAPEPGSESEPEPEPESEPESEPEPGSGADSVPGSQSQSSPGARPRPAGIASVEGTR